MSRLDEGYGDDPTRLALDHQQRQPRHRMALSMAKGANGRLFWVRCACMDGMNYQGSRPPAFWNYDPLTRDPVPNGYAAAVFRYHVRTGKTLISLDELT